MSEPAHSPDWGAAPAGTTHYYVGSRCPWRDLSGKDWKWWQDGKWHSPHDEEHAVYCKNLDVSSSGLLERNAQYLIARP